MLRQHLGCLNFSVDPTSLHYGVSLNQESKEERATDRAARRSSTLTHTCFMLSLHRSVTVLFSMES